MLAILEAQDESVSSSVEQPSWLRLGSFRKQVSKTVKNGTQM